MDSVDDDSNTFTDLEIQPKVDSLQHFFFTYKYLWINSQISQEKNILKDAISRLQKESESSDSENYLKMIDDTDINVPFGAKVNSSSVCQTLN